MSMYSAQWFGMTILEDYTWTPLSVHYTQQSEGVSGLKFQTSGLIQRVQRGALFKIILGII